MCTGRWQVSEIRNKKGDKSTLKSSLLVLFTYTLNWFDTKTSAEDPIKVNGSQTRRWNKKKQRYIFLHPVLYEQTHKTLQQSAAVDASAAALEHRGGRIYFWNCSLPPHFPAISPSSLFSLHLPFIRQKNSQATLWGGTACSGAAERGGDYTESITFCGRQCGEDEKKKMVWKTLMFPAVSGRVWWSVGKWWR